MRHSRCVVHMHYLARCKVHECKRCLLQCPRRIWMMGVRRDFREERVQGRGGEGGGWCGG